MIKPSAMYELAADGRLMIEMQDVMDMVADVMRLEWLVTNQCRVVDVGAGNESWEVREMAGNFPLGGPDDDWRDAIDEAMRDSDEHN